MSDSDKDRERHRNGVDILFWAVVGVLALLLIGAVVWKNVAVRGVEERAERQRQALVERSRGALEEQTMEMLRTMAIPLAWGVRDQVLEENYGAVNAFFNELVRQPEVRRILLVGANDSILVSTDKNLEGRAAPTTLPGPAGEIAVHAEGDSAYLVVVPITGFAERRGTVVLTYDRSAVARRASALEAAPQGEGAAN
ncbi:hypothetical protein BH18GEM1_BH18GEM1_21160 [soil metagenome]